jgi:hypothetical protein
LAQAGPTLFLSFLTKWFLRVHIWSRKHRTRIFHESACCDRETGNPLAGLSGAERARIIWPSFRASSGVGPCDVLFKYASGPTPCGCPVAQPSPQPLDGDS